jgi:hypothetical protein
MENPKISHRYPPIQWLLQLLPPVYQELLKDCNSAYQPNKEERYLQLVNRVLRRLRNPETDCRFCSDPETIRLD